MRPASSASSTSPLPRHVTSHLVSACEPMLRERRVTELQFADHSLSPHVEQLRPRRVSELEFTDHFIFPCVKQRHSAPIEPELACDPVPKPRSRRCFVCGTTGTHPLDFRVCPRTAVLLRRSLAKFNDDGRLVSFDGSPLPMTRHPGGVAAHIISRSNNPIRAVLEPPRSTPAPRAAYVPPLPVSSELHDRVPRPSCEFNLRDPARIVPQSPESVPMPRVIHIPPRPVSVELPDRVLSPPHEFNSSSPHAIPPVDHIASAPEHVPHRRVVSPYDLALSRIRTTFISLLLEFMLDALFRAQLRAILMLIERLNAQDPSTLRERMRPVYTHISHFIPVT